MKRPATLPHLHRHPVGKRWRLFFHLCLHYSLQVAGEQRGGVPRWREMKLSPPQLE